MLKINEPNNMVYWADLNSPWFPGDHAQFRWKHNVWCGVLGDQLIGPFFPDGDLDDERFLNLMQIQIMNGEPLDDVPLALAKHHWLKPDGALAHNDFMVQSFLHGDGLAAAGL